MAELIEVVFLSQTWAEAMIPEGHESIISITDHGSTLADLNKGWRSILRIQFDDIDPDEIVIGEFEKDLVKLSTDQATEIAKFILFSAIKSKTIVVHCRFGQSRSPAVAKAISEQFGLYFPPKFDSQNKFVQKLVFNALSRLSEA